MPAKKRGFRPALTTSTASTAPRRERSNREDYAEQKLTLATGNNVGKQKNRENLFRINDLSMTYCPWCARRAHHFSAISTGYLGRLRDKVHFGPESTFRESRNSTLIRQQLKLDERHDLSPEFLHTAKDFVRCRTAESEIDAADTHVAQRPDVGGHERSRTSE
jgi:hypothetical protein